jgi:glycosyltransferase involved in cell wall biosynthesis
LKLESEDATSPVDQGFPFVSVVIPTLNSEKTLEECLKSVFAQDYPRDKYEVILVDGGSKDGTLEIAKRFPARIVTELQRGRGKAYDRGIVEAGGEAVAFLDSDAYADPSWLREMFLEFSKNHLMAIVYCGSMAPSDASFLQKCIDALNYKGEGRANGVLYRTDVFLKTKGFDERLNYLQENELEYRIAGMGYRINNTRNVLVWHYPRDSLKRYFEQNMDVGIGKILFYRITGDSKILFNVVANSVAALLPVMFLLFDAVYVFATLLVLNLAYAMYVARETHREYRKLKYIITVPFMNYLSIMGEFAGYLKALPMRNPHNK